MATDWEKMEKLFSEEHLRTGITVKAWCEKMNLKINTARRYIKPHHECVKGEREFVVGNIDNGQNQSLSDIAHSVSEDTTPSKKRVLSLRNQNARTHGHYSEFITTAEDNERYVSASIASLSDELNITRVQQSNLLVVIKDIETALRSNLPIDKREKLHESLAKYESIYNIRLARIESLDNSILNQEKIKSDIAKNIVLTKKIQLDVDKLSRELGHSTIPLQDIYNEILAMDSDGMMNT